MSVDANVAVSGVLFQAKERSFPICTKFRGCTYVVVLVKDQRERRERERERGRERRGKEYKFGGTK